MTAHKENCKTTTPSVLNLGPKKLVTNGRLSTTASHVHVDLLRLLHLLHGQPHLGLLDQVLQALAAAHVQRRGGGPSVQGGLHAVARLPLHSSWPDPTPPASLVEGKVEGWGLFQGVLHLLSQLRGGARQQVGRRPGHQRRGGRRAWHGGSRSPPIEPSASPRGGDAAQLVLARREHCYPAAELGSAERVTVQPGR